MGIRVEFDRAAIIQTIKAVGRDTTNAVYEALKVEAREIRELARDFAPVDDHTLEGAIIMQANKSEKAVYVGIDPTAVDEHGTPVQFYGWIMHEQLEPYGSGGYTLGKKSQDKDGESGQVGGLFLQRAFEIQSQGMMTRIGVKVKRIYR